MLTVMLIQLKNILGERLNTDFLFIYGELGRYPLKSHRQYCIKKYSLNVVNGECNILVTKAYHNLCCIIGLRVKSV